MYFLNLIYLKIKIIKYDYRKLMGIIKINEFLINKKSIHILNYLNFHTSSNYLSFHNIFPIFYLKFVFLLML